MESNLAMYKMFIFVKSVVPLLRMYPKKVIWEAKLKLCGQRHGMQCYLSEKSRRKLQKYPIPRGHLKILYGIRQNTTVTKKN